MKNFFKKSIFLNNKKITIFLAAILILAAFLRFYQTAEIAKFEYDDEYNSYLVYDLVKNHHLSPIGQEGSFGGIHWGPWHYLYLVPFYMLSNLDPIGGFIGEGVLGLFIIISYFYVGSKLFSPTVGLLAAFLRSIIFSTLMSDLTISPAYPSELVAVWFLYFLVRLYHHDSKALIVLAFLIGMMSSVHVVLLPLILVLLLTLIVYKPVKISLRLILQSLGAFIIPTLPLLLFEVKYRFIHLITFWHALAGEKVVDQTFTERLEYVVNFNLGNFYRLFDSWFLPGGLGLIMVAAIILFLSKKKGFFKANYFLFLFISTLTSVMIYYTFYPRHVPEYYFLALNPLIILFVAALIIEISRTRLGKLVALVFLAVVIFSNLKLFVKEHTISRKFSLAYKERTVKTIIDHQKLRGGDFSVSYMTDLGRNYGFKYFFTLYGATPRPFPENKPVYTIVLPAKLVREQDLSEHFGDIGIIYPEKENH